MFKTIIFDLDGTLLNTLADLHNAVNVTMKHFDFPTHTLEEVRSFVGNGIKKLVERSVPANTNQELFEQAFLYFKEYYTKHCQIETCAYEGIETMLTTLSEQGKALGIVSNKNDEAVKQLAQLYFAKQIKTAVGVKEGIPKKPDPTVLYETMNMLKADKKTTLYVGDSEVDAALAKNAGVSCMLVSWGFRDKDFLLQQESDGVIDHPKELIPIVIS